MGEVLMPLVLNALAHPSGIGVSPDENSIYVSETSMNRILRFSRHLDQGFSVFHQLSGRFGPTAIAVSITGYIFVAHFDFESNEDNGKIVVLDSTGEMVSTMSVGGPEITG